MTGIVSVDSHFNHTMVATYLTDLPVQSKRFRRKVQGKEYHGAIGDNSCELIDSHYTPTFLFNGKSVEELGLGLLDSVHGVTDRSRWTIWVVNGESNINQMDCTVTQYDTSDPDNPIAETEYHWKFFPDTIKRHYGTKYVACEVTCNCYTFIHPQLEGRVYVGSVKFATDKASNLFGLKTLWDTRDRSIPYIFAETFTHTPVIVYEGDGVPLDMSDASIEARIRLDLARHSMPIGLEWEMFKTCMSNYSLDTNMIAFIKDTIDLIKQLKDLGPLAVLNIKGLHSAKDLAKFAADGWLQYRYAYLTTKSDVNELITTIDSRIAAIQHDGFNSYHATKFADGTTYRLKVDSKLAVADALTSVWSTLKLNGLAPDLANAWDMLPFSFVVDWFGDVGDWAENLSKLYYRDESIFCFDSITLSKQRNSRIDRVEYKYYARSILTDPPDYNLYEEDTSTNTVVKRCIDAGALIVGMA